jgi:transposase
MRPACCARATVGQSAVAPSAAINSRRLIERCYCRLKDFKRIATRYDKLARNDFSALCLVAILALVVRGFRFWDNMASVSAPG